MTENDVWSIATKAEFDDLLNRINLTDRQKEIYILRYERGFTFAEICEEVGYSRTTVYEECKVIRKKLQKITFDII